LIIIVFNLEEWQQCLHTYLLVLVFMVLMVISQSGTGLFKNAFDDRWTTDIDDQQPVDAPTHTDIINHSIKICGFANDSLMV
jgi:hypothetical protein